MLRKQFLAVYFYVSFLSGKSGHVNSDLLCSIVAVISAHCNSSALTFFTATVVVRFIMIVLRKRLPTEQVSHHDRVMAVIAIASAYTWTFGWTCVLVQNNKYFAFSRACLNPGDKFTWTPNFFGNIFYGQVFLQYMVAFGLNIALVYKIVESTASASSSNQKRGLSNVGAFLLWRLKLNLVWNNLTVPNNCTGYFKSILLKYIKLNNKVPKSEIVPVQLIDTWSKRSKLLQKSLIMSENKKWATFWNKTMLTNSSSRQWPQDTDQQLGMLWHRFWSQQVVL